MKITISKRFAELVTGFPKTVLFFVAGLLILSSFNNGFTKFSLISEIVCLCTILVYLSSSKLLQFGITSTMSIGLYFFVKRSLATKFFLEIIFF